VSYSEPFVAAKVAAAPLKYLENLPGISADISHLTVLYAKCERLRLRLGEKALKGTRFAVHFVFVFFGWGKALIGYALCGADVLCIETCSSAMARCYLPWHGVHTVLRRLRLVSVTHCNLPQD
jgi:hypothetical protein